MEHAFFRGQRSWSAKSKKKVTFFKNIKYIELYSNINPNQSEQHNYNNKFYQELWMLFINRDKEQFIIFSSVFLEYKIPQIHCITFFTFFILYEQKKSQWTTYRFIWVSATYTCGKKVISYKIKSKVTGSNYSIHLVFSGNFFRNRYKDYFEHIIFIPLTVIKRKMIIITIKRFKLYRFTNTKSNLLNLKRFLVLKIHSFVTFFFKRRPNFT